MTVVKEQEHSEKEGHFTLGFRCGLGGVRCLVRALGASSEEAG